MSRLQISGCAMRRLKGIDIPVDQVPLAIDEFPALFIAAANAQGKTRLRGAEELRVKESDRIQAMADGLDMLGVENTVVADGIDIIGGDAVPARRIMAAAIDSLGDHRIAMAFAVAGLRASDEIVIDDCANVATSFPGFVELARRIGLTVAPESDAESPVNSRGMHERCRNTRGDHRWSRVVPARAPSVA